MIRFISMFINKQSIAFLCSMSLVCAGNPNIQQVVNSPTATTRDKVILSLKVASWGG